MPGHFPRITSRGASPEPHDHMIERRAMTSERIDQPAKADLAHQTSFQLAPWGRPLAITTAIVFCISSVSPLSRAS
jgi:hypothetical protein